MFSDSSGFQGLWKNARTAIVQALDNLDQDVTGNREENVFDIHQLSEDVETYKKLLEDAQMQHFELSKQSRLLIAEKEAEIKFLRENYVPNSQGVVEGQDSYLNTTDPASKERNLLLEKLLSEKMVLQESLTEAEEKLRNMIRDKNELEMLRKHYNEINERFIIVKADLTTLKSEYETSTKQKNDAIDNLVSEYSKLAAEMEFGQNKHNERLNEITKENEELVTRLHAMEHSISELADRSAATVPLPVANANPIVSEVPVASPIEPIIKEVMDPKLQEELTQAKELILQLQGDILKKEELLSQLKLESQSSSESLSLSMSQQQQKEVLDLQQKLLQIEQDAHMKHEQNQTIQQQIDQLFQEKSTLQQQNQQLLESSHSQETKVLELTNQLTKQQEEIVSLQSNQSLSQQSSEQTQQELLLQHQNKLQELTKQHQEEMTLLQEQLLNSTKEIQQSQQTLTEREEHLQNQIQLLQNTLSEQQTILLSKEQETNSQGMEQTQQLQQLQQQIVDTQQLLKVSQEEHQIALDTLKNQHEIVLEELKNTHEIQMKSLVEEHSQQIAQKDQEINELQGKLLHLQQQLDDEIKSNQEKLNKQLEEHGIILKQALVDLQSQCDAVKEQIVSELQQKLDNEIQLSQEKLSKQQEEHENKLKQDLEVLQSQCDVVKEQALSQLQEKLQQEALQEKEKVANELKEQHQQELKQIIDEAQQTKQQELNQLQDKCNLEKEEALVVLTQQKADELTQALKDLETKLEQEKSIALTQLTETKDQELASKVQELETQKAQELEKLREEHTEIVTQFENNLSQAKQDLASVEERFEAKTQAALAELQAKKDEEREAALHALRHEMQGFVDQAYAERDEHLANYTKERKLRKKIHNRLLEIQGNIRVICRVRPILEVERRSGEDVDVTEIPNDEELIIQRDVQQKTKYEYDRVFGQISNQEEVFEAVQPLCVSVLDGFNVCIFAYGQTGSGKTYTMEGYGDNIGVSPRAISELFTQIGQLEDWEYTLTLSMLEIYNETIRDLLDSSNSKDKEKLEIRQTPEGNQVPGLTEVAITSATQVRDLMKQGQANRAVGSHDMNEHSSRSHSILTVTCRGKNKIDGATTYGKLHLIDLAGSERISKTDASGDRLKEAQNINKSLSALGDVITALGNKKSTHVPYRNSKLTFLLQDSLGGNSKVLTFVNISPAVYNLGETVCSLNFASRCRSTELGQAKRQVASSEGDASSVAKQMVKEKRASISASASGSLTPSSASSTQSFTFHSSKK